MVNSSQGSKNLFVIGGPNGSGKSTFATALFSQTDFFINPDILVAGISPTYSEKAAFQAGRMMILGVKERLKEGLSFAFESTLSGKNWLGHLNDAKMSGYRVTIYFLYLDKVSDNIKRVNNRVRLGGHSVDASTIRRRYKKCFESFWNFYRPLCDEWEIINNSGKKPKFVLNSKNFEKMSAVEKAAFERTFLRGRRS